MSSLDKFKSELEEFKTQAEKGLKAVDNLAAIEDFRLQTLGKKGQLTNILKQLGALPPELKPEAGKLANEIRVFVQGEIDRLQTSLNAKEMEAQIANEQIDVTLPGVRPQQYLEHPVNIAEEEIVKIFERCGFFVDVGPEVEHEFYNFDALNIPANHPTRQLQDTFYVKDNPSIVLRTQTSPVQIRTMLSSKPPIRMVSPGRVYRSDYDATHSPMFHQIEGLLVDRKVTMADLKGILAIVIQEYFGAELKIRLRPSFFPFTEPSAEVDMECCFCSGKGCRVCKQTGWLEIAGCGMVDPEVFKAVDLDSETYRGFAFGFGIERMAMLKFGISDLRAFYESDLRFVRQFERWRR